MMDGVEFSSACYYKYASIDVDRFIDNLVGGRREVELLTYKYSLKSASRLWFTPRDVENEGARSCGTSGEPLVSLQQALAGRPLHG